MLPSLRGTPAALPFFTIRGAANAVYRPIRRETLLAGQANSVSWHLEVEPGSALQGSGRLGDRHRGALACATVPQLNEAVCDSAAGL